ncbi:MAG: hypothetical protein QOI95_3346 [Acidimicrobiaceae bacterium]|jgi:hypothetical protein
MSTVVVIIAIWAVLSLPFSVVLGFAFRDETRAELVGMDGADAVFRRADGTLERVALVDHAPR